jgi:hypothetical protein
MTTVPYTPGPRSGDGDRRPAAGIWWLSPGGALVLVVPVTLLIAAVASDAQYRSHWGTPKALTAPTTQLFLAGAMVFMIGSFMPLVRAGPTRPRTGPWPPFSAHQWSVLERVVTPLFWLTIVGYVAFGVSGLRNGLTLDDIRVVLIDQENVSGDLKRTFASIPGITTLTQLGIAFVVVAVVLLGRRPDPTLLRRVGVVIGLGLVRAFFVAERLAVLELVIPVVAIVVVRRLWTARPRTRRLVRLAPLAFIPALIGGFALLEYSRSWVFFAPESRQSYGEFVVDRLAGYYATAYNNGQLTLLYDDAPGRLPYHSLEALWTAPGAEQLGAYEALSGRAHTDVYTEILGRHGTLEFNSPSGLAIPFVDFGTAGGFLFLLLAGAALGWLYRRFTEGEPYGVLLYPVLLTGVLEIPRYLYWTQGRLAPALVVLGLLAWRLQRAAPRRQPVPEAVAA